MQYSIGNGTLEITVDTRGAELVSVKHRGSERLWQNENGSWSGHAPVLFPVCGTCDVVIGGKRFCMPKHGFAKTSEFALVSRDAERLRFCLASTESTRKAYPFEFRLFVEYRIVGARLEILFEVESGDEPVYFACGGHESFAVNAVRDCKLVFPVPTRLVHRVHDGDGRLTGDTVDFGTVVEFDRLDEYLQNDGTLIFGDIAAREVALFENGVKSASITFDGFSNLLLWRPIGADMICIEPWTALPDEVSQPPVEFAQRRGVFAARSARPVKLMRSIEYF